MRNKLSYPRRVLVAATGWGTIGVGISAVVAAHFGVSPYDALTTGVAQVVGIPFGVAVWVVAAVTVSVAWALGRRPGWGTVAGSLVVGAVVAVMLPAFSDLESFVARVGLFSAGLAAIAVGVTAVVVSEVGAGPPELVMLALCDRGALVAPARWGLEAAFLAVAVLLGGEVGIGTAIAVAAMGLALHALLPRAWKLTHGSRSAPAAR